MQHLFPIKWVKISRSYKHVKIPRFCGHLYADITRIAVIINIKM